MASPSENQLDLNVMRDLFDCGEREAMKVLILDHITERLNLRGCLLVEFSPPISGSQPVIAAASKTSSIDWDDAPSFLSYLEEKYRGGETSFDIRLPMAREGGEVASRRSRLYAQLLPLTSGRDCQAVLCLLSNTPIDLDVATHESLRLYFSCLNWLYKQDLERLETERRLEKALKEIDLREKERNRWLNFFYMTTHDLKAPISSVYNYLKTVLRKSIDVLDERMSKIIERSLIRLDEVMDMIGSLLELTQLEDPRALEEFNELDLKEVLWGCMEIADSLAKAKGLKASVQVSRSLPGIFGLEKRISQLVMNLLTNAIKYTPRGGRITLKAFRREDEVIVQVEDNGIGINPQSLPRIFDEFYQAESSSEGSGLGLSIARRIVDMHRGRIWAESPLDAQGRGTRVSFALPLGWSSPLDEDYFDGKKPSDILNT